jgi:hypothetical protein
MNGGEMEPNKKLAKLLEKIQESAERYHTANGKAPELFRCAPDVAETLKNNWKDVGLICGSNMKIEIIPTAQVGVFALLSKMEERK